MPISRNAARLTLAAALAVSSLGSGIAAVASEGGSGGKPEPQITGTQMGNAEETGVEIEVGATHARRVVVTVGERAGRERIELTRAGKARKIAYWEGILSDRKEQCARVVIAAINSEGRDKRAEKVCIFGESEPEPPGGTLPLP